MNRRGFLGLLCGLPFLGFLKKKLEVPASVVKKARASSSSWPAWVVDDKGSIVGFVGDGEYYSLLRK